MALKTKKSLLDLYPELCLEWDYEKNKGLKDKKGNDISKPEYVEKSCSEMVWWKLHYVIPDDYKFEHLRGKEVDFSWASTVKSRTIDKTKCPFLSHGNVVCVGYNDLKSCCPELAEEWDYKENYPLTPEQIRVTSKNKIRWKRDYIIPDDHPNPELRGKTITFKWKATLNSRVFQRADCPYLSSGPNIVWEGFNDLKSCYPDIAKEWDYEANAPLTPEQVRPGSHDKVWWCMDYLVPDDYPNKEMRGTTVKLRWKARIKDRTIKNYGCPYLAASNTKVLRGFNDLATLYPEIAAEWDYTKNKGLIKDNGKDVSDPSMIRPMIHDKVWWKKIYTDPNTGITYRFEWESRVSDRVSKGVGCPYLMSSKGEQTVQKALFDLNIKFQAEYSGFDDRRSPKGALLRDDFAIFDKYGNVVATIEFHGRQHYEPVRFGGISQEKAISNLKETQARDIQKTDYLINHKPPIKQLIISHKEFNVAEDLVKKFIKELSLERDLYFEPTVIDLERERYLKRLDHEVGSKSEIEKTTTQTHKNKVIVLDYEKAKKQYRDKNLYKQSRIGIKKDGRKYSVSKEDLDAAII